MEIPEGQRKSLCTAVWAPSFGFFGFGCGRSIPPNYECWTCGWEHLLPKFIKIQSLRPSSEVRTVFLDQNPLLELEASLIFYFWPPLVMEAEQQNSTAFGAIMCRVPSRHR